MSNEDIANQSCHFWARLKRPIFGVHDSQGSAETLVTRGGITNYHLIAYSFSNISAKNYQNRLMGIEVIVCHITVVFWDTVLCENLMKFDPVVFELKWGRKWNLCCDSSEISRFSFIWHTGVLKRIRKSQFWFQRAKRQSFLYISWKFGENRISDPRVLGEKSCTAGVDNCYHD